MSNAATEQAVTPMWQEATHYAHGTISWAALDAVDLDAAKSFYGALFGWSFEDVPIGDGSFYTMALLNGKRIAGMSAMNPEMRAAGTPSYWWLNISVDDVNRVAAQIDGAGGRTLAEPMEVLDSGRMTMMFDGVGALVGVWQARAFEGAEYSGGEGVPCWYELYTHNVAGAARFYETLLGWENHVTEQDGMTMAACHADGRPVAMILPPNAALEGRPDGWAVYFGSSDVAATAARIEALGGTILLGPTESMGYPYALAQDPQGAHFFVVAPPVEAQA